MTFGVSGHSKRALYIGSHARSSALLSLIRCGGGGELHSFCWWPHCPEFTNVGSVG